MILNPICILVILSLSLPVFAGDLALNEACISVANQYNLIDPDYTLAAIHSGEVVILSSTGSKLNLVKDGKSFVLNGASCSAMGSTTDNPGNYLMSGLATYIQSGKATKESLDKIRATCSKSPFFKKTLEETIQLNATKVNAVGAVNTVNAIK